MTVSELIELLKEYPANLRVVVNGYEEGYDDLSPEQISVAKISLNTGTHHWEGQHGDSRHQAEETSDGDKVVEALVLRRVSN
ncbi:MAG: hypothetical protein OXI53_00030 [Nitrospira sp.]|nr:hypothetical protein [Nitrospira sp.]MDE0403688.1 hypothetical protein [Nitrospira sp.]MDE0486139.1 hypothetical protein [Nitrospira sp.]